METQDPRIEKIAKRVKELRKQKGYISYEEFSSTYKIPKVQYWRMEKGTNFTINSLLRVLDAHGITIQEFFQGVEK